MRNTNNRRRSNKTGRRYGSGAPEGIASTRLTAREIREAARNKHRYNPKEPTTTCPECEGKVNVTKYGQIKSHRIGGGRANIREGDVKCLGTEMHVSEENIEPPEEEE